MVCKFCALIGCHCTKYLHKLCKTSWWKKWNWLFCCVSVRDFKPKIVYIFKIKTKKLLDRKLIFFYEERYTYYESKKAKNKLCHHTTYYSIFNVSSCRKPEIQNECLKSPKSSEFAAFFNKQVVKNSLLCLFHQCFNNY